MDIHHFILDGWYSHLMGIPSSWDLWRWKWSKVIHAVRHPQAFISAFDFSCYSWGTLVSKFCRFCQSLYQCLQLGCDHATRAVSHERRLGSLWKTDAQLLYMVLLIQIESTVNMILPPGYLNHFWMWVGLSHSGWGSCDYCNISTSTKENLRLRQSRVGFGL